MNLVSALLALLESVKVELARSSVTVLLLEALVQVLLLKLAHTAAKVVVLRGRSGSLRRGLRGRRRGSLLVTPTATSEHRAHGHVADLGSSSERHTLNNGSHDSRSHTTTAACIDE